MFARKAFFRLKSTSVSSQFKLTFQSEVLPLLFAQKGFVGELVLANPGSLERITTSLWESVEDAQIYDAKVYPQVLKILAKTIDGKPKIHTFDQVDFTVREDATGVPGCKTYPATASDLANDCAASSPRSTLSTPSTSACSSSSPG